MTRDEWVELDKKYANVRKQGFCGTQDTEGMPSAHNWQVDVIQLLAAICEELWQLRNGRRQTG